MTRGIVLTHGAGGNAESPLLLRLDDAFSMAGFRVTRVQFEGPPYPAFNSRHREQIRAAAMALGCEQLVVGGHSYGGRMCSVLAAAEPDLAAALLLLSYPLHPPRKREQLRVAHFSGIRLPTLFVHGTRDPFGLPEELEREAAAICGPVRFSYLEGAGHDLRRGAFDADALVLGPLCALLQA